MGIGFPSAQGREGYLQLIPVCREGYLHLSKVRRKKVETCKFHSPATGKSGVPPSQGRVYWVFRFSSRLKEASQAVPREV